MSGMQLVASLAQSLAWPLAAVLMVFLLRKPLRGLLERLSGVKGPGGVEASFAVAAVKVEAASALVADESDAVPTAADVPAPRKSDHRGVTMAWERTDRIDELLAATRRDTSTENLRLVVTTAWHMASSAGQEAAVRQGASNELLSLNSAADMLDDLALLKPGIRGLVAALGEMRERAFSSEELDPRSVRTFVKAAGRVARSMDRVPDRVG